MIEQLKNIVSIRSGLYAKTQSQGEIAYLLAEHFSPSGKLIRNVERGVDVVPYQSRHLLSDSEILFTSKGTRNRAIVYRSSMGKAVASTSFFVLTIRPDFTDKISAEYLAWYFNHPTVATRIRSMAKGSGIPSVSKEDLLDLPVPIPEREVQELIVQTQALAELERDLVERISQLKLNSLGTNLLALTHPRP